MEQELKRKFDDAIWVAKSLFERGKTAGSSANLSFRHGDTVYITGSGTCFGRLTEECFSAVTLKGECVGGIKPSKELPLHLMCYEKDGKIGAVVHVHSFYATLYSCTAKNVGGSAVPNHTPYLKMKVGSIALVPYAPPGSPELFDLFRERIDDGDGYLLANHGSVVPGKTVMDAFYGVEELEESCHIAWELERQK